MKKFLSRGLAGFLIILTIFICIGFFLPEHAHVQERAVISAPTSEVFETISRIRTWPTWSPWKEKDPKMEVLFRGPDHGVGATQIWQSETQGKGQLTLVEANPDTGIKYEVLFDGSEKKHVGGIALKSSGAKTEATWYFELHAGINPIGRWFNLWIRDLITQDLKSGLRLLKAKVEDGDKA